MAAQNALQDNNQNFSLLGVSGTAGTAETRAAIVDDDNNLHTTGIILGGTITPIKSSIATFSSVQGMTVAGTILASNASRLGGCVANNSTASLYLKLGTAVSTTSYTAKMFKDDYFEIPFSYIGEIQGIWSVSDGSALVTELT